MCKHSKCADELIDIASTEKNENLLSLVFMTQLHVHIRAVRAG